MRRLLLALGALWLVASCQTMSPEACAAADWRALGEVDGAAGAAMSRYEARQNDCAKVNVAADFEAYSVGRQWGLRSFCQPTSGFQAALRGYSYAGVCPADLEGEFMLGYRDGAAAYQAKQAFSSAEGAVSAARSERDSIAEKIAHFEGELRRSGATEQERATARSRLSELDRDMRRARDRMRDAESDRVRAGFALDRARFDIGQRWGSW